MANCKIKTFKSNPTMKGMAEVVPNIVFSKAVGEELKMQLIKPWDHDNIETKPKRPLIVFLQGSAFTFPNVNYEIPQLAEYAKMGYVVATITHRNSMEGHPAPAYLQDAKTAIRFLRKNADVYGIDPQRVCFWGTSSGGNTALLVALTGDDPRYKTDEFAELSDSVSAAVDCFGPTDMIRLCHMVVAAGGDTALFKNLVGGELTEQNMELLKEMSPIHIIQKNMKYPPILLLHGDADTIVPYDESTNMHKALRKGGYDAEMICVKNAPHEGSFWSRELHTEIANFIERKI